MNTCDKYVLDVTCIQGGMCTVFIPDDDRVVSIAIEHLEPVQPNKGDRVREHVHATVLFLTF